MRCLANVWEVEGGICFISSLFWVSNGFWYHTSSAPERVIIGKIWLQYQGFNLRDFNALNAWRLSIYCAMGMMRPALQLALLYRFTWKYFQVSDFLCRMQAYKVFVSIFLHFAKTNMRTKGSRGCVQNELSPFWRKSQSPTAQTICFWTEGCDLGT